MNKAGSLLFTFGISTLLMELLHFTPSILFWLCTWGKKTAFAVQLSLMVLGAILFWMSRNDDQQINI